MFCPKCGMQAANDAPFCTNCGNAFKQVQLQYQPQYQQPQYGQPSVPTVATGGLMALSIVALFFFTVCGIVAIVKTTQINKCATVEEQQKKIKSVKTWSIVGIVIGVLMVIGTLA